MPTWPCDSNEEELLNKYIYLFVFDKKHPGHYISIPKHDRLHSPIAEDGTQHLRLYVPYFYDLYQNIGHGNEYPYSMHEIIFKIYSKFINAHDNHILIPHPDKTAATLGNIHEWLIDMLYFTNHPAVYYNPNAMWTKCYVNKNDIIIE